MSDWDDIQDAKLWEESFRKELKSIITMDQEDISHDKRERFYELLQMAKGREDSINLDRYCVRYDDKDYQFKLTLYQAAIFYGHDWALEPLREAGADINLYTKSLNGGSSNIVSAPELAIARLPHAEDIYLEESWELQHTMVGSWSNIVKKGYNIIAKDWLDAHANDDSKDLTLVEVKDMVEALTHERGPDYPMLGLMMANPRIRKVLETQPEKFDEIAENAVFRNNAALLKTLHGFGVPINDIARHPGDFSIGTAIYHLSDHTFDYLLSQDVPTEKGMQGEPCTGDYILSMLARRIKEDGIKEGDTRAQTAYRHFVRKALKLGADTNTIFPISPQLDEHGTLLHINALARLELENRILMEEGFLIDATNNDAQTVAEFVKEELTNSEYGFYNTYRNAYAALWQRFSNEEKLWNPFTGSKPSRNQKLSDHPLALLHAFSAIDTLKDAMHPKFWQGHMDVRANIMDELYPYQQRILARDYAASAAQSEDVSDKPAASWVAKVAQPPHAEHAR